MSRISCCIARPTHMPPLHTSLVCNLYTHHFPLSHTGVELTHGVQWLYHRIAHGNTPYPARPSYMYAHNNNATTHSNDTTNSNDVESLLHGGVTVGGVHVCEEDGEASGSDGSSGGGGKTHHGLSNGHSQHNGFSQRKEEQHQGGGKGKEGEKKKSTWDDGEASPFAMDDDGGL